MLWNPAFVSELRALVGRVTGDAAECTTEGDVVQKWYAGSGAKVL